MRHLLALASLALPLALGATVVPVEELEANKLKLLPTQSGNNLMLDWATQPNVYYFVEGTPDLTLGIWIPAKLLKDTAATGNLTLGTAISSSKAFYRLSLEGDPDATRLREDSDGDKIINVLEADASMDAFVAEDPIDTDSDGIPDYFEQFHYGSLEHDGDYVAVEGGLTAAQAFAAATDPSTLDSDGDGRTDAEELTDGTDANYDQTRNNPQGDDDKDGLTNAQEHALGTKPLSKHTDSDGVEDGLDGWPHDANFAPARQGESYALVDLSSHLTYPSSDSATVQVDDNGGVLLASHSTSGDDTTYSAKYYNWSQTLTPSAFNATLETTKAFGENETASADYSVHMTRSGLIHFSGSSRLDEDILSNFNTFTSDIRNHRDFHDPFNVTYDANNQTSGTFTNLSSAFTSAGIGIGTGGASNEESVFLRGYEYSNERTANISMSASDMSSDTTNTNTNSANVLMQNGQVLSSGTTDALFDNTITLSQTAHFLLIDTGAHGSQLATHEPAYSLSPAWDVFPFTYPEPDYPDKETRWADSITDGDRVISAQEQDILIETANASAHRYSLNGSTFHDFQVWNPSSKQLKSTAVGKTSDDLVMLLGDSDILINQTKRSVSDLVNDADGWSNFELEDINSHGMIVGTAEKGGATKVIALLKVEFETFADDETREIGGNRSPNWKAHTLNLDTKQDEETHYGDYKKCVAHIWSNQPLNLAKYLSDYDSNQEVFENPDVLNWKVDGQLQTSFELNLETSAPNENQYERYNIEMVLKGSSEPIDQLIVTVVPPDTLADFDQWLIDNQDLGWLDALPAVYGSVVLDEESEAINPEPAASLPCDNWSDSKPGSMFFNMSADTYYHPDAYHEIRSNRVGDNGHQACYDIAGELIRSGVSAGTADRSFWGNLFGADSHKNVDAIPFVWAVQLDGTPAQGEDGIAPDYSSIDNPIMHEGKFIGEYLELRPPIANDRAELIPGNCP